MVRVIAVVRIRLICIICLSILVVRIRLICIVCLTVAVVRVSCAVIAILFILAVCIGRIAVFVSLIARLLCIGLAVICILFITAIVCIGHTGIPVLSISTLSIRLCIIPALSIIIPRILRNFILTPVILTLFIAAISVLVLSVAVLFIAAFCVCFVGVTFLTVYICIIFFCARIKRDNVIIRSLTAVILRSISQHDIIILLLDRCERHMHGFQLHRLHHIRSVAKPENDIITFLHTLCRQSHSVIEIGKLIRPLLLIILFL